MRSPSDLIGTLSHAAFTLKKRFNTQHHPTEKPPSPPEERVHSTE
jgi:hypothetical protein